MTGALCRRCGTHPGTVVPYWATDGHRLCRTCCATVAELLDQRDAWPPVPWDDDEEVTA